jgi:hypothetical protein
MRLTIIRDDGIVGIDGKFKKIDLSSLPRGIRAVQWNSVAGHVEYDDMTNTEISSMTPFQTFVDAWNLAASSQASAPGSAGLKAAALNRIDNAYQAAVRLIISEYPRDEVESWSKQEAEARALLNDSDIETPWLDSAAAARGLTKADLAVRIINKVNRFVPLHGALTGRRQKLRDQIAALGDEPTQAQLDAIQW